MAAAVATAQVASGAAFGFDIFTMAGGSIEKKNSTV